MGKTGFRDWLAYQKSMRLADCIFRMTQRFPKEEVYSLTDQVRRSSRSVVANLAESYGKRAYPKHFRSTISICQGENCETEAWCEMACRCGYIEQHQYERLVELIEEVGKLLSYMRANSSKFT